MLTGRTIEDIATQLAMQRKTKLDFVIPTSFLMFTLDGRLMRKDTQQCMEISSHAHSQIAAYLNIPNAYYNRMQKEVPELLQSSVNAWMERTPENARRMIRTLDGKGRAFLSDKYLPIDYWDTCNALVPVLQELECRIDSAEITETRMYIKATTPKLRGEVRVGDVVQAGVIIGDSEVGMGSVFVKPFIKQLICSNGMVVDNMSLRRTHVGKRIADSVLEDNRMYTPETVALEIAAFLAKARDTVRGVLNEEVFNTILERARNADGHKIHDATEAVEDVTKRYNLLDVESKGIMNSFVRGGNMTRWGMTSAITETAHAVCTDYDRSTELETIGGTYLYS